MKAVIFAGPSLPPGARRDCGLEISWRPPVRQGELYNVALCRPAIIGVIDGYFEVTPAVWHKEILWAMTQGIHVYGAASIGALRAAELDNFGMKGSGRIYEDFRDGILEDDDEVAVLHGPAELGYPPLSEAMVNIRSTLAQAAQHGILVSRLAATLTAIAKLLFYKERNYPAVIKAAVASGLPATAFRDFIDWLPRGRVDQKRLDAEAMLNAITSHLAAGVGALQVTYELADSVAWQMARRDAGDAV